MKVDLGSGELEEAGSRRRTGPFSIRFVRLHMHPPVVCLCFNLQPWIRSKESIALAYVETRNGHFPIIYNPFFVYAG